MRRKPMSPRCERCGKRLYPTLLRAIAVAIYSSRMRGTPLRVYGCPHAPGYHLTKQPLREVRGAA